ncbi:MAG: helix-turn-helix transcriptional regulator [Nanoarchaeota archaeon]
MSNIDKRKVGNRIRELREKFLLSQVDFARAIGVKQSAVSLYEKGKRLPDPEFLLNISEYSGASIEWLLTGMDKGQVREGLRKEDKEIVKLYSQLNDKHKSLIRESMASFKKAEGKK